MTTPTGAMKTRLFTPGPIELPEVVIQAMCAQVPHPRSAAFIERFRAVSGQLQVYFKTAHEVLILTASGTGAMEAAVVNFVPRGAAVVVVEAGKFGERWSEIARTHGLGVNALRVPWGEAVGASELAALLARQPETAAVFLTHSETSTGVAHDIAALAEVVRAGSDALVIVDGISSVGVLPFYMDRWGVDVCVSGSQKGAMVPPGLAFLAAGDRAWARAASADLPRYYFDCQRAREGHRAGGTPWTPAASLVCGLHAALGLILSEGLEVRWQAFARQAQALRAALRPLGLGVFARAPSDAVTAVELPPAIDARAFVRRLRDHYRVLVAGGQDHVKRRIFRVAHMGTCDHLDLMGLMAVIELALADFDWTFEPGAGVGALQAAFLADHGATSLP